MHNKILYQDYENIEKNNFQKKIKNNKPKKNKKKIFFIVSFLALFAIFYFLTLSPGKIKTDSIIEVSKGDSLYSLSKKLKDRELIKSQNLFKIISKIKKIDKNIHTGKYVIKPDDSIFDIIEKIKNNEVLDESINFTIFEGWPNYKIAESLEKKLSKMENNNFSKSKFLELAKEKEGFLWPDTYKINPDWSEEKIVKVFNDNYKKKIKKYLPFFKKDLEKKGKTEKEIITMASIVEAEAGNVAQNEKKMVAGILWNRIKIKMPLQADAVFSYIKQEHIDKVLYKNLKVDSEYNVYKNIGLPLGPIGNPGLAAIRGALYPKETDYLFYLTDDKLKFHYAISYRQHLINIKKYLKK